ncbi:MAG: anthranilate synthase component I family protein [Pseudomonadota bacterium]
MKPPFDIAADLDTPVSAYLKLRDFKPRFLLESVEGGERFGRYSFIGFGDALELKLDGAGFHVGDERYDPPTNQQELLDVLRSALKAAPNPGPIPEGVPFGGGLVGACGYDMVRYFETLPRAAAPLPGVPDGAWVAPDSLLIFDHLTHRMALLHDGPEAVRRELRRDVIKALRGAGVGPSTTGSFSPAAASISDGDYMSLVRQVQEHITAGDVYQLVLSIRFSGQCSLAPFDTYRALRLLNPSPYMYFCELGDVTVVGSSPEALVQLQGREAALRPIAGTRPRGASPELDEELARGLLADPKEIAEHVMLVDLARNDLGRVAVPGTVKVDPYRVIERYSHVMHLVSGVRGTIEDDTDAFDLFAAAFPAGTLVGAPKVRAMEIIDGFEPVRRGLYAGTVGYFGHGGNMDQAIAIRTMVFQGDEYSYQAGAGIVADSRPDAEYEEVLAKSAILRRALAMAEEGL